MDLDEIEDIYARDIEKADKEFLQGLVDKKDSSTVEKNYTSKIVSAREKYYKSIETFLEKQKANLGKKTKKEIAAEVKVFKVDTSSLDLTPKQKKKLENELAAFKKGFARRNLIREKTPYWARYFYYFVRLHLKRFFGRISDIFHERMNLISIKLKNGLDSTKEFSDKTMKWLSSIPDKIIAWFAAQKKKAQERKEARKKAEEEKKAAETKVGDVIEESNKEEKKDGDVEKKV